MSGADDFVKENVPRIMQVGKLESIQIKRGQVDTAKIQWREEGTLFAVEFTPGAEG